VRVEERLDPLLDDQRREHVSMLRRGHVRSGLVPSPNDVSGV
jgi:hypothetical protein